MPHRDQQEEDGEDEPPPVPPRTPHTAPPAPSSISKARRSTKHRNTDTESIISEPPPYALVDSNQPSTSSQEVQRNVTGRAADAIKRRSSRVPGAASSGAAAPAPPPKATAPPPTSSPPNTHRRRDSHPAIQRPDNARTPPRASVAAAPQAYRHSSRSSSGTSGETSNNIGGFRAQMRRDNNRPPSSAPATRTETPPISMPPLPPSRAGTRHTQVVAIMPPAIQTVGDVLGNPMKIDPEEFLGDKKVVTKVEYGRREKEKTTVQGAPLQRKSSVEDPLEYLRRRGSLRFLLRYAYFKKILNVFSSCSAFAPRYDTVCIVDGWSAVVNDCSSSSFADVLILVDSSSMEGALWVETREALAGIADVAARYDADGVDIYFLNDLIVGRNMKTGASVKRLFDRVTPQGITPTGAMLEGLLLDYMLRLERARDDAEAAGDPSIAKKIKPVNFLVITDGRPTDDPESVIVQAAKRLDEGRFPLSQVGIQFVQIGTDPVAAEALRELDDELASTHGIRDMVDTVPFSTKTGAGGRIGTDLLVKTLLGGINRRQDRQKSSI
ncbi:hypothetical protein FRB97_006587 [Tulasnella sp. 331]|nr:hypothetical protein FRB97_006587 [Tulasnella sp. 331]